MISGKPLGTIGTVASLFTVTLYQGNHDRNNKLWIIVWTDTLYAGGILPHINGVHNGKFEIISFVVTFRQ